MQDLRSFIKDVFSVLSANLVNLVVSVLSVLILPKLLSIGAYGSWQYYSLVLSYAAVLHFGWPDGMFLRYGGKTATDMPWAMLKKQFNWFSAFELIVCILFEIAVVLFFRHDALSIIYAWVLVSIILTNLRRYVTYTFQAVADMHKYSIVTIIDRVIFIVMAVGQLLLGLRSVKLIIYSDILSHIVSLGLAFFWLNGYAKPEKKIQNIEIRQDVKSNFSAGVPLLIANIAAMLIIGSARLLTQAFWGIVVFAKISLVLSISNFLMVFITAVSTVMFPFMRRLGSSILRDKYIDMRNVFTQMLLTALFVYYPLKEIIYIWLPKYQDTLKYLPILIPIMYFESKFELLSNSVMKAERMERQLMLVNVVAVLISSGITLISILVFNSVLSLMVGIVLSIAFRSETAEILISRRFEINTTNGIISDIGFVMVFILSGLYLPTLLAAAVFSCAYLVSVLKNRKSIRFMLSMLK